jgi:methionyl-tRNA synthetase
MYEKENLMSNSDLKKFYITTTLPYVNSDPHIGFAMEIIRADVIARYKRSMGYNVFFNTGTDEHGAKIYENAVKQGIDVQVYVDGYAEKFRDLTKVLNIQDVHFIRTTDEKHVLAAQLMWKRCYDNGYIYKKTYQAKYCVGCELNKTDSELENGKCLIHPNREIEFIDEENYFFKWSLFSGRGHKDSLLDFYDAHPDFVIPDFRFNEIKAFVERGLEDFSISRLQEKMPWGVSIPAGACDEGDEKRHVMYVWFDALTSYISTLGWGTDEKDFDFWKEGNPVQYCGKDNLRQQSAMWQAMLMASGLPNSKHIIIDGFITSGGQKMSKSVGNVINPLEVIEMFRGVTEFPEEVLRFVLLHDISSFEDGDITMGSMKESYQAYLANGIGNLTNRIMKMATTYGVLFSEEDKLSHFEAKKHPVTSETFLEKYDITHAFQDIIITYCQKLDSKIQAEEPFKVYKTDQEKAKVIVKNLLHGLWQLQSALALFMPQTSAKILECISENKMPEKALFSRLV